MPGAILWEPQATGLLLGNSLVVDLTISPIKKELDLHVGSDGGLKEDCKVICCCCFVVVVVHMYRLPVHFIPFISYFIYTLKVTRVHC